jgi:serine/threonine-protein kinase
VQETSLPYIVMEFLEGETLQGLIDREDKVPIDRAVDLVLPVISALSAAHAHEVVHRDLKPHNVFLANGPGGSVVPMVLDFGVAKFVGDGVDDLTKTASILGTPEYMAPEQARGISRVTHAADQYGVAVVLYRLLSGRAPYDAGSFIELIHEVAAGGGNPLGVVAPELPDALAAVVEKAMARLPEDRYGSMTEFGRALLPFASQAGQTAWAEAFEDWVEVEF